MVSIAILQAPFDRTIDVLVGKLRKKLEEDINQPKLIKTIRGRGYIFVGGDRSAT